MTQPVQVKRFAFALAVLTLTTTHAHAEDLHPIAANTAKKLQDAEKPFILVVSFDVPRDSVDEFISAAIAAKTKTDQEPGCVQYELSQSTKDPTKLMLYEKWKSVAALDYHLKQPYLTKLLATFNRLLDQSPSVQVMQPVSGSTR